MSLPDRISHMKASLLSVIRHLRGERPGMSAGRAFDPSLLALLAPSIAIETQIQLADVSYYQGEIDFRVMRATGIDGVIIRAGQRFWVDIRFKENWQKVKEAGLPRGSYWLYDSREDPKKQAALWWSLIKDDPGELVHAADLEEGYGGAYGSKAHMKEFILEFQRLSRLPDDRIAIYTGFFWFTERIGNDPFFERYPLWLAWYANMSVVRVPAPWSESDLLFWQRTSSGDGKLHGVGSLEIDLNWYCCTARSFSLRFGLGAPAPNGGTMDIIKGTAKGNVTRRNAPAGSTFSPSRYLVTGDTIEADWQDTTLPQWLHLTKINGVAVVGEEWASAGTSQQYIGWQWVSVPSEPPPDPDPVVKTPFTLAVDGYKPYAGELEKA
ncbi:hypothetical protein EHM92_02605 [bacterium]|nr:MAG: hypothetical protein EHM92_02605 [bacterium]